MKPTPKIMADCAVAILVVSLTALGLHMLTLPAITLFRAWPYYLLPDAEMLFYLAIFLAWFRDNAGQYLIWATARLHRWLSAILIIPAIGTDGLLHFFNIPHMEGWWLPLIGTSVTANLISAWIDTHKKYPRQYNPLTNRNNQH